MIASKKTLDQLSKEADPWLQPYNHAQPKHQMTSVSQAAISVAQLATMEANLEKKLMTTIQERMQVPEPDAAMDTSMEDRVNRLEQQLQHVHMSQNGLEHKLTNMQQQIDVQEITFSNALDQKMLEQKEQMDRIESLLLKRTGHE